MLIAADRAAGGTIQPGQPVAAVADQHPVDRGGRQTQPGGDAGRAEPLAVAQPEDVLLEVGGGSPGAVGGDAGPVDQAGLAELLVAAPPAGGGGAGDTHLVGDVGDRPSRVGGDPADQDQSSRRRQPGVSVGHEASSERGAGTARTSLGGLTSRQQPLWAEHLAVSRQLQRSVMALLSGGMRIVLTSKRFLPKAHRFQTAYSLPNQRVYEWQNAGQIWAIYCRNSHGRVSGRICGHSDITEYPEKPSAGIGGIGMTSRRRLSSTGPTSSGRQTCQDVQTHQSIARCISVNPGSTCRWPPGPGRAGDWAGTNRRPAAAATTDRFDGGVGAVSIRSVDRRPLGQLLTGFCRPSLVLLAALASGWPRHLTRSATGGLVAVGRPGRVQTGPGPPRRLSARSHGRPARRPQTAPACWRRRPRRQPVAAAGRSRPPPPAPRPRPGPAAGRGSRPPPPTWSPRWPGRHRPRSPPCRSARAVAAGPGRCARGVPTLAVRPRPPPGACPRRCRARA